ncbi:MAG: type II toxin-antitoxin system RelE/ParE family toxin [Pseudoflavonifractor sp.]|nr:type II toxin-antitoxin system RelE/ParE family toxin [Pseudoflavonifractor sp.]
MVEPKLRIILLDEASAFIRSLPVKAQKKIVYNMNRVKNGEVDKELFEKLSDTIWELRTIFNNVKYRLLAFWDSETRSLVVVTHGFTKKTQKTPPKEISKAEMIRKEYISNRNK